MKDLKKYYDSNQKKWDELAELHYTGDGYNITSFVKNRTGLYPIEIEEMGNISGRSLLHLQCHFGKDTLSWALRGASPVVGVDFSEKAINFAKDLAQTMRIDARFINCNLYDLKEHLNEHEQFDVIFSSYGAIAWLHDLQTWAKLISFYLKPGGFFYIVDAHPTAMIFDNTPDAQKNYETEIQIKYPYFKTKEPLKFEEDGSYADPNAKLQHTTEYGWNYSVSEIINSLIQAGLHIEFFNEHTKISWQMFKMLEQNDKWYVFPASWKNKEFPLLFSLKARKK